MTFYVENETEETFAEGEVFFTLKMKQRKHLRRVRFLFLWRIPWRRLQTLCWKWKAVLMRSS